MKLRRAFYHRIGSRLPASEAFSLVEIMVAVSILAVMIVGLLAMFYHVQRAFRLGVTQSDIMEGGRSVTSALTRELQETAATQLFDALNLVIEPSHETAAWGQTAITQELPSGQFRTNYLQDLTFLTVANGNWSAVGYRIFGATNGLGTLYRTSLSTNYASNPIVASNELFNLSWISYNNRLPNDSFHRVLDGVVHFLVTPYDTNGYVFTDAIITNPGGYGFTNSMLPAFIDIELGVLEPAAIERFRASQEADPSGARARNYLQRNIGKTHVFRQRVTIRPAATQISATY